MKNKVEKGFTLIELVIVIAIIGLLSSVAIPSYLDYVVRTNRADAKDKLTEVIYELERYNTRQRSYTTNMTDLGFSATNSLFLSGQGLYSVSIAACGTAAQLQIARCARVTAAPVAGKAQEGDGNLTIDTRGIKGGNWD